MHKLLKIALLTLIGLAVVAGVIYAMRPRPVFVDTARAVVAPLEVTVVEEGKTRIRERYVVSSPLTGRLRRITHDPGDQVVSQETVLAVIEPTDPDLLDARTLAEAEARARAAEAAVRQSKTAMERTRASYDFAETEFGRIAAAFDAGAANQHELDDASTKERTASQDYRAAQYGHEIAKFELEVARSALLYARGETSADERARMELRAPINGVVLRVIQESVAVVAPGAPLIEVGDPSDLELVIDVLSRDGVNIEPGQHVIVDQWGKPTPLAGIVRLVEPSAFTKVSALGIEEQRVNVIADFVTPPDKHGSLGDGFRVEARVVIWEQDDVLQVPTSAIFRHEGRWSVFRIADGRVALRDIETGQNNGRVTQVLDGLAEGDQVVLHPGDQLKEGVRVVER